MAVKDVMRWALAILAPAGVLMAATPLAAQGSASKMPLTIQDPASAQPTLPKPMSGLSVTGGSEMPASGKAHSLPRSTSRTGRHRVAHTRNVAEPIVRPALANVELVEPLPHPPQPPHVAVPVPAYPLENFVTYFTAPPPPVVCAPTRSNRFMSDPHLVDERPTLCTADNP